VGHFEFEMVGQFQKDSKRFRDACQICTPHTSALTKGSLPDIMASDNVVQSRGKKFAVRISPTYQMTTVNGIDS
jgi:hypothetical protein